MRIALASCATIDLVLPAQRLAPVDGGGDILVGQGQAFQGALHDRRAQFWWKRLSEFEFGAATEALLTGAIA
jgi:hypothetical protein